MRVLGTLRATQTPFSPPSSSCSRNNTEHSLQLLTGWCSQPQLHQEIHYSHFSTLLGPDRIQALIPAPPPMPLAAFPGWPFLALSLGWQGKGIPLILLHPAAHLSAWLLQVLGKGMGVHREEAPQGDVHFPRWDSSQPGSPMRH